jgi:TatD DNase family protein
LKKQEKIFRELVKLAIKIDVPVIVHSRKAEKECIEILEEMKAKKVVMHCFSGNMKLVGRIIRNKWTVSIPASVKYSEQFQNMAKKIPIAQLMCETDSPFLHPDRQKNNEPALVVEAYKKIAEIKKLETASVERILEDNYRKLISC